MFKSRRAAFVVPSFFILNTLLSMMNRWALGHKGFRFPLMLTICQALFSFIFTLGMLSLFPGTLTKYRKQLPKEWKGIAIVGFWVAANISLNNLSLVHITLSLNQVIRATIPLVTAVISSTVHRQIPPRLEILGLSILCFGVAIAISEATASGDTFGVTLCILSVFAGAAMLTASSRVLSGRINSIQLSFCTSPFICTFLFPLFLFREREPFSEYATHSPITTILLLISSSIVAGAYNIVHNDLVAISDPVTTTVLGQIKIVGIMVLSAVLLGEGRDFSSRMSFGCIMAIAGFSIYSWAKLKHPSPKKHFVNGNAQQEEQMIGMERIGGDSNINSGVAAKVKTLRVLIEEPAPMTPKMRTRSSSSAKNKSGDVAIATTPPNRLPGTKTPGSRKSTESESMSTSARRSARRRPITPGKLV